ncbi:unnamed protein product [Moneuplotes crassus]|uniref:Uncharacterized protein n=1 Tax=Euplotes crassus TaxID=5936 RepID=A0AAD1U3S9_EUPCR|nr:unnamed protein product [Moneuplotes crassus]
MSRQVSGKAPKAFPVEKMPKSLYSPIRVACIEEASTGPSPSSFTPQDQTPPATKIHDIQPLSTSSKKRTQKHHQKSTSLSKNPQNPSPSSQDDQETPGSNSPILPKRKRKRAKPAQPAGLVAKAPHQEIHKKKKKKQKLVGKIGSSANCGRLSCGLGTVGRRYESKKDCNQKRRCTKEIMEVSSIHQAIEDKQFEDMAKREKLFKNTEYKSFNTVAKYTSEVYNNKLLLWEELEEVMQKTYEKNRKDSDPFPKRKQSITNYMSGNIFWHLISNQYFPFLLHSKYHFRTKDCFSKIKSDIRKCEPWTKKTVLNWFKDPYSFRDFKLKIKDILFKSTRKEFQFKEINQNYISTFLNYVNTSFVPYSFDEKWKGINIMRRLNKEDPSKRELPPINTIISNNNLTQNIKLLEIILKNMEEENDRIFDEYELKFSEVNDESRKLPTEGLLSSETMHKYGQYIYDTFMPYLKCLYEPQENSKGQLCPRRIRLSLRDSYQLEIANVENEDEKKIIREQSKKNKRGSISEIYKQFKVRSDEYICQVCNNGDSKHDNQIVFCEECGACAHQKCYGIYSLPEGDWNCTICKVFGSHQGQYIQCALCPNKGGLMKPCNLLASDTLLINIGTGIKDNVYQQKIRHYLEEIHLDCANFNTIFQDDSQKKIKIEKMISKMNINRKVNLLDRKDGNTRIFPTEDKNLNFNKIVQKEEKIQSAIFGKNYKEQLKQLYKDEGSKDALVPNFYAWVHMSCVLFTPELYHTQQGLVKLNKIDKKRFSTPCYLCKTKNGKKSTSINLGSTVKCSETDCENHIHVECARRRDFHLVLEDFSNLQERVTSIYCEKHTPYTISKELDYKKDIYSYEILNFLTAMDDLYRKHEESKPATTIAKFTKSILLNMQKYIKEAYLLEKSLTIQFIKQEKTIARDPYKMISVKSAKSPKRRDRPSSLFSRSSMNPYSGGPYKRITYKLDREYKPSLSYQDWQDICSMYKFPWKYVTKKLNNGKGKFSVEQVYDQFHALVESNDLFTHHILNGVPFNTTSQQADLLDQENYDNEELDELEMQPPYKGGNPDNHYPYCYCKREYVGESNHFIRCRNLVECPIKWYHPSCIESIEKNESRKNRIKSYNNPNRRDSYTKYDDQFEIDFTKWYCRECKDIPKNEVKPIEEPVEMPSFHESSENNSYCSNQGNGESYAFDLSNNLGYDKNNFEVHRKIVEKIASESQSQEEEYNIKNEKKSSFSSNDNYQSESSSHENYSAPCESSLD